MACILRKLYLQCNLNMILQGKDISYYIVFHLDNNSLQGKSLDLIQLHNSNQMDKQCSHLEI